MEFDVKDIEFDMTAEQPYVLIYGTDGNVYPFKLEIKHLKQISNKLQMGYVCERCGKTGTIPDFFLPIDRFKGRYLCEKCYVEKKERKK